MHLPASLLEAMDDPLLSGDPLMVYLHCFKWLEPYRPRPLSAQTVADVVRIERRTASRILQLLVDHGYLERGGNSQHGVPTYRVLVTRYHRAA